ncbi:MAG: EAL domain-containing protein [Oleiphilaceae bacterium]|nr:EAL domain-containing protein [Oleiphilaceae bacterium]
MTIAQHSSALLSDITEAVAQVFDVICTAIIVEGHESPAYCAGDQEVGQRLIQLPVVLATLGDGLVRTGALPQNDTMKETAFIGIEPLLTLQDEPSTVIAFATRHSQDLDGAMALVHALATEVASELILFRQAPFLAEVLAEVECGVTIADVNLKDAPLIYANDAFTRMTGYSRAETLGKNCRFLQGELRDQPGIETIRKALACGEACTTLLTNFRRNGQPFKNKLVLRPVRAIDGRITHVVGIQYDVTTEHSALDSLDLQRRRYKSLVEAGASHTWQMSAAGELQSVDSSWLALAGVRLTSEPPDLAMIRNAVGAEAAESFRRCWAEALQNIQPFEVSYQLPADSPSPRWFQDRVTPILDDDGNLLEWFGVSQEITALKRAEQNLHQIIQAAPTGMLVVDRKGRITLANTQAGLLFGYSVEGLIGMDIEALVPESSREKHQQLRSTYSVAPSIRRMGVDREVKGVRQDRTEFDAEVGLSLFGEGHDLRVIAAVNDITELKDARKAVERAAYEDRLTGLLSREGFNRRLQQWIDQECRQVRGVVLTVDIVSLRDVNDAYGYDSGDQLLAKFGRRLEEQTGEHGLAGRISGNKFSLFLLPDPAEALTARLDQLRDSLLIPFELNGVAIEMPFKLGYTCLTGDQRPAEGLLREAEMALSQHRKEPSVPWVAYSNHLQEGARQRIELTRELRLALKEDQFELHFQPKVDLATGTLVACEALLRWNHPERGLISPGVFIPIAEQSQLIGPIGDWVVCRACQHLRDWRNAGLEPVRVAVNVSVIQFEMGDFASRVRTVLEQSGVAPEELALEVTESVFEQESEMLLNQMYALRDMGVWLSLDDFGTGYSSLLYLQRYPFNEIKIDQGFVFHLLDDSFSRNIVETVMKLAKVLDAEIIAEGIESAEVGDALLAMGCRFGQGFFYSMPLEAEDFRWLLEQRSKLPLNIDASR